MNVRDREEHSAASEDLNRKSRPGSPLFEDPFVTSKLIASLPSVNSFPYTPPDTESELSFPDYLDMDNQSWGQPPPPVDWATAGLTQQNVTAPDGSPLQWPDHSSPAASREPLQSSPWSGSHASMDAALSPVLSLVSQGSHNALAFSESDPLFYGPGAELSPFPGNPNWFPSGAAAYPQGFPTLTAGQTDLPSEYQALQEHQSALRSAPAEWASRTQGPNPFSQAAQATQTGSNPMRTTLPPNGPFHVDYQPAYGQLPSLQPYTQGFVGEQDIASHVSIPQYHQPEELDHASQAQQQDFESAFLNLDEDLSANEGPPGLANVDGSASNVQRPLRPMPLMPQPEATNLFPLGTQEQERPAASMIPGPLTTDETQPQILGSAGQAAVTADQIPPNPQGASGVAIASEGAKLNDEQGAAPARRTSRAASNQKRGRTHPLYSAQPDEKGLYHCPYANQPPHECKDRHKPTKLKCNYDKWIDSHLKPFSCAVPDCPRKDFSSNACLLRHEREKHGMHGHGLDPYQCELPGCPRQFPRDWNRWDHMRRQHNIHRPEPPRPKKSSARQAKGATRAGVGKSRKASTTSNAQHTPAQVAAEMERQRSSYDAIDASSTGAGVADALHAQQQMSAFAQQNSAQQFFPPAPVGAPLTPHQAYLAPAAGSASVRTGGLTSGYRNIQPRPDEASATVYGAPSTSQPLPQQHAGFLEYPSPQYEEIEMEKFI